MNTHRAKAAKSTTSAAGDFAVEVVTRDFAGSLFYSATNASPQPDIGCEVQIEIGHREGTGWVIRKLPIAEASAILSEQRKKRTSGKSASAPSGAGAAQLALSLQVPEAPPRFKRILTSTAVFPPNQLPLFKWMSEYYGASLGEIIANALPARMSPRMVLCAQATAELARIFAEEPALLLKLGQRAPLQRKIAEILAEAASPVPLSHLSGLGAGARSALNSLVQKGLAAAELVSHRKLTAPEPKKTASSAQLLFSGVIPEQLTQAQENAFAAVSKSLKQSSFSPFLLFGVTGSGKTEIYLRAVEQVLQGPGCALIVVPEIALTPQFIDQFQSRLNAPIALLHSQVGAQARWEAWEALLNGSIRVALGARSAVFAPFTNLSLIVIDEEHESSYKQSDGLRYNARDVAVMRAKLSNAVIVLGSATPSFESLVNAQNRRYKILELPERATTRPLPALEIVDLNKIKRKDMPSENISPQMYESIKETLAAKGQVIILYNRRGFASFMQCETCSETVICPNCSVALTLHRKGERLLCHYCGLSVAAPTHCAVCRDPETSRIETGEDGLPRERKSVVDAVGRLERRGGGTERVVDELAQLFPDASIIRMDRDAIDEKGAYRKILGRMRSGAADILVGTQMIAKGHDLPGVTLVGIISADVGLHLPDFRSSEKAFQLLTQASGRCGRGKDPGRVLIQTHEPNHPTIVATATGRFKAFARYELEFRKRLAYPPFGRLLRLVVSSSNRHEAREGAELLAKTVRQIIANSSAPAGAVCNGDALSAAILGPAPAPHEKLRARWRWHLLVKAQSAKMISQLAFALYFWRDTVNQFQDFRLAIDVDPVDML